MDNLDALVADLRAAFVRVHREVFLGDPVANSRLAVDVVDAAVVAGTPVLVLITPWTMSGVVFPPDDDFPESLEIGGRRRPVFRVELPGLGPYRSVVLPPQTATLHSMSQARTVARSWITPLHEAIRAARAEADATTVVDPPGGLANEEQGDRR